MSPPKMPKRVQVGPRSCKVICDEDDWGRLVVRERDTDMNGYFDQETLEIHINPKAARDLQVETLIHEVQHVVLDVAGIDTDLEDSKKHVDDEQVARSTSPLWVQVLRDNPKLVRFVAWWPTA